MHDPRALELHRALNRRFGFPENNIRPEILEKLAKQIQRLDALVDKLMEGKAGIDQGGRKHG